MVLLVAQFLGENLVCKPGENLELMDVFGKFMKVVECGSCDLTVRLLDVQVVALFIPHFPTTCHVRNPKSTR